VQQIHRIFLLSPANLSGIRAGYVLNTTADFDLACRLRRDGVTIGELFSFVSGLYFRGKLAYAQAFAVPPIDLSGSFVITSSAGLLRPDTIVNIDQVQSWVSSDIDAGNRQYRVALDRDCALLLEKLPESCGVVLLGSIATAKYVDPLLEIFRDRLFFPSEFVGRGDMSRGGLMLRSVESRKELAYTPLLAAVRHGKRPPKLIPSTPRSSKPTNSGSTTPTPE
jgi:hypothetical protein